MLVVESYKVEKEVSELLGELILVLKKAQAGETPVQILGEELQKIAMLINDAAAVPADFEESLNGVLRAVVLKSVDLACLFMGKPLAS